MEDRFAQLFGLLGLFSLAALTILLAVVKSRRDRRREDIERVAKDKKIEEGIAQGILIRDAVTDEVYPRCVICGCKATAKTPTSGASWMDQLPLLNRLFSLPPRYTIVDNEDGMIELCKIHKGVAVKKLEQFHAALRAERSQFNAQQEDKVAQMDAGGLYQVLLEQHKAAIDALDQRREKLGSVPALPAAPVKRVMSTLSTASDTSEDMGRPRLEVVNST